MPDAPAEVVGTLARYYAWLAAVNDEPICTGTALNAFTDAVDKASTRENSPRTHTAPSGTRPRRSRTACDPRAPEWAARIRSASRRVNLRWAPCATRVAHAMVVPTASELREFEPHARGARRDVNGFDYSQHVPIELPVGPWDCLDRACEQYEAPDGSDLPT